VTHFDSTSLTLHQYDVHSKSHLYRHWT
jgi:hypothetical protein